MNRLVRISLTLFASATVMLVLVFLRLNDAKKMPDPVLQMNETKMAYIGIGISGALLITGLFILISAAIRAKKTKALHG